jgi:hypothetical protein
MIDADNRIRVVVEHKCGAKANCEPYPLFDTLTRFNDPLRFLCRPARLKPMMSRTPGHGPGAALADRLLPLHAGLDRSGR